MKSHFGVLSTTTTAVVELHDITNKVEKEVQQSKIKSGSVTVYTQHTTCAIKINENEEKLREDMLFFLEKIVPQKGKYGHDIAPVDGRKNAHSHLKALLLTASETIPIQNGKMMLGSWQRIFLIELDGPREKRNVIIHCMGE